MFIYEVDKGEIISLTIKTKNTEKMEWKCPVVEISEKGKCVLVPPLKYEGKILTFNQEGVFADAIIVKDGKPFIFKGCYVQYIKMKENKYHAIVCKSAGTNLNRRSSFRVTIDEYCYVNHGKATVDAFVKDMSSCGFCFVVGHYDGAEMEFVHMIYKDSVVGCDINVMGRVVRREDLEDGRTVFGCYMIPRPDVDRYLSERQRKTMKPGTLPSDD